MNLFWFPKRAYGSYVHSRLLLCSKWPGFRAERTVLLVNCWAIYNNRRSGATALPAPPRLGDVSQRRSGDVGYRMARPPVWHRRGRVRVRLPHRGRACGMDQMPRRPNVQVFQDSANDCGILYQCDHPHGTLAFRTLQGIDFIDLVNQACPRRSRASRHRIPILRFLLHGHLVVRERPLGPDPIGIPAEVAHQMFEPIGDMATKHFQPLRAGHKLEAANQRGHVLQSDISHAVITARLTVAW
jgi:hypothetical protein